MSPSNDETGRERVEHDTSTPSKQAAIIAGYLDSRIIGQERVVRSVVRDLEFDFAKPPLWDVGHPMMLKFLAGPTGVGKTEATFETARGWIGKMTHGFDGELLSPVTKIDGPEYTDTYAVANLRGSSKGLVGYDEDTPLMQHVIDRYHFEIIMRDRLEDHLRRKHEALVKKGKIKPEDRTGAEGKDLMRLALEIMEDRTPKKKVILFDEIERAHRSLWNLLISWLDGKPITFTNGSTSNLTRAAVFMTSNIGEEDIMKKLSGRGGMGFTEDIHMADPAKVDDAIYGIALKAIEKLFPPALVGRIREDIIVFRPFNDEQWMQILDLRLRDVTERHGILNPEGRMPLHIRFTDRCKKFLLRKGISKNLGARKLKVVVKKQISFRLARGSAKEIFRPEDFVVFDTKGAGKDEKIVMCVEKVA